MFLPETIHQPTLVRLLRGIDELPRGATGALAFTDCDSRQGTVLIEDRRVCWASAPDMENRLTDILRAQSEAPLPPSAFEEVYQECHRKSTPLGETLLTRGLVSSEGLRYALRQHSAEAIARLSSAARLTLTWDSNRTRRYNAQFTFGTSELLCSIGALGLEPKAEEADLTLREVTPDRSVGVAFLTGKDRSLPVAQVSAESWCCQSLVDLGEWALAALGNGAPGGSVENVGSVLASDTVNSLKRAWRSGETVFVRWTGDKEPPASRPAEKFDLEGETVITR
jgi:hypothetical protein